MAADLEVKTLTSRHLNSYTIDTPSLEETPCCTLHKIPCTCSRRFAITCLLFAVVTILFAVAILNSNSRDVFLGSPSPSVTITDASTSLLIFERYGENLLTSRPALTFMSGRSSFATPLGHRVDMGLTEHDLSGGFKKGGILRIPEHTNNKVIKKATKRTFNSKVKGLIKISTNTSSSSTGAPLLHEEGHQTTANEEERKDHVHPKSRVNVPVIRTERSQENGVDEPLQSQPLSRNLVPKHYKVVLHPHQDKDQIILSGVTKITVTCLQPTRRVYLHATGLQVNTARVSYNIINRNSSSEVHDIAVKRVVLNSTTQLLMLKLAYAMKTNETYELSFTYVGIVNSSPAGLYKSSISKLDGSKRWMAFTSMAPTHARRVFPCFDDPAFRTTFDVEVLRRKDYHSISTMPILKIEMSKHHDYVNDVFIRTPPIPTHLIGLAVTDFTHVGNGIVKVWIESSSMESADLVLQSAVSYLQMFERYFEIKYPLPKLDIVISPDNVTTQGSLGVVILPSITFSPIPSTKTRKNIERNIAKAILRQWIGGIVSFQSWDDFWLNEAIIEYVLYLVGKIEGVTLGQEEADFELAMQHMLSQEIAEKTHPLSANSERNSSHSFDAFSTSKLVLHKLRITNSLNFSPSANSYFGCLTRFSQPMLSASASSPVTPGTQTLLRMQRYKTIGQNDFWAEISKENSRSFVTPSLVKCWTKNVGYPLITLSRSYGQNLAVVRQDGYYPNASGLLWNIPITYTDGEKLQFQHNPNVFWLTTKEAILPSVPKDDDWLILNLRGYGYYRVNYDARNWNLIIMELNTYHTNIDVLNRARIIDDLFDLADMSILPYGTALHASEYLRREKEIIPWLTVLKKWQYIEAMLSTETIIEKWKLFIIRLLIHHVHSFKWSNVVEDNEKRHLRRIHYAWACKYKYAPCVIEARHAFNFFRKSGPQNKRLLVDHQVTVFCTVIEDGGEDEWQALYDLLSHASSPVERTNIIVSLGCSRNPSTLRRYFQVFTPTHMIAVPLIFEETARRSTFGRSAASEFVLENSHALKVMYPEIFGDILVAVFGNINTMAELRKVTNLFKQHGASLYAHKAALERIKQSANRNFHWVMSHYAEVSRWLKRDVTEFILDDQVMRGNITSNATIGGGSISDVFFEESDFTNGTEN